MKKKILFLMLSFAALLSFLTGHAIPSAVQHSFETSFRDAERVEWQTDAAGFSVRFVQHGKVVYAGFTPEGRLMAERVTGKTDLPDFVRR